MTTETLEQIVLRVISRQLSIHGGDISEALAQDIASNVARLYAEKSLPADHVADAKDAQRYRWLREHEFYVRDGETYRGMQILCCELDRVSQDVFWSEAELDAAIDAAMLAAAGEGRGREPRVD